jgi:RHH-type proline utilization regulon transcriptional repressor/proline dehydrogenase/delta 1-pyrroline-5-carboxylate dehydrogenase
MDERACVKQRLEQARLPLAREQAVEQKARELVAVAREHSRQNNGIEAFLREYDLSSREGVLLMCLAEALLRIPDADTANRLIRDRLSRGQWDTHLGESHSLLVNASTWGMLLTGRLLGGVGSSASGAEQLLRQLVSRVGEPVVRTALQQAMRILAMQFVMGRDLPEALKRAKQQRRRRFSYDCLGEAAITRDDVEHYLAGYLAAIDSLGLVVRPERSVFEQAGISVKLSAIHPRYEFSQRRRVLDELVPRLQLLAERAAAAGIGLTLDAEEAERLELSLDIFERVFDSGVSESWQGLGLAVQSYQKRAWPVLMWLQRLARDRRLRIPVRLVKGAYWDSEIKRAQVLGLDGYPVFTRKSATDVSYLACAQFMLHNTECFFPQMASHNAHTIAWIDAIGAGTDYELQCLHGMGESLFTAIDKCLDVPPPVRIYAPVGSHEELLPYLVRRLLENGANSSFLNQLGDAQTDMNTIVANPCQHIESVECRPHPQIPLPSELYGAQRRNAAGWDLSDPVVVAMLADQITAARGPEWRAAACIDAEDQDGVERAVRSPASGDVIGTVVEAQQDVIDRALYLAVNAAPAWDALGGSRRAALLTRSADLFEQHTGSLVARIVYEGGRTIPDAIAEVREAVDYFRYYGRLAQDRFETAVALPGPTGELNELQLHGRGVFACISPWNFPLAIFAGQVAAALAAGNAVLAKPARQTALTGYAAVALMHQAGIPGDVLHFIPGRGAEIGAQLCSDKRLAGIAFTGSTETAWTIQQALADRRAAIVPLVAETGGQNVMIADSSALPEQLVTDVLQSAYNSAGQRCSALRVLFVQNDIADRVLDLLIGAMQELRIGDPANLTTDVGPVIDRSAIKDLQLHVARMQREACLLGRLEPGTQLTDGSFFPLHLFEIDSLTMLTGEVFGPVLHVVRFRGDRLDQVVDAVNATGYGLTLGVHSRIEETWQRVCRRARVGNLYINRNMIGAVVGTQPFGGEGLSGTGPKAGGPNYLYRFATERTRSINTAAMGGNTHLLSLPQE